MIPGNAALRRKLAAGVLVATITGTALANLLVDAGFERDDIPLQPFADVVGPPLSDGFWGVESGYKAAAENGLSPLEGVRMLHLNKIAGDQTQAWQAVDLTSFAAFIDSGSAVATFSAWYNVPEGSPGKDGPARAIASIMFFDDVNGWPNYTALETAAIDLDDDAGSWEQIVVNADVPVGTRWAVVEVHYLNSSLTLYGGYVDNTYFEIPEPSSLCLLALAAAAGLRRR